MLGGLLESIAAEAHWADPKVLRERADGCSFKLCASLSSWTLWMKQE